jgi:2'-5' RNA ligase
MAMAADTQTDSERLFFSLWPTSKVRQQMVAASEQAIEAAGGNPIPPENYHITLAFLGNVPRDTIPELIFVARGIRFPAFEMQLDRTGYWPRSQIAWLKPSATPSPLEKLVAELWVALSTLGITPDEHSFAPHVSLVRRVPGGLGRLLDQKVVWPVRDFALVQSDAQPSGSVYSLLEHFPADA